VIALVLHIQNIEYRLGISLEDQPDLLHVEAAYAETGGGFWVAGSAAGEVVGTLGLQVKLGVNRELWGVVKKFFVRADQRGRPEGISARLYATLLEHARTAQLRGLVLDTLAAAARSHAFYSRAGFRRIGAHELPLEYEYPDRDSRLFRLDFDLARDRPFPR
jgi:N-acetylglutamate synthase-like GNAT family acetyltransferase